MRSDEQPDSSVCVTASAKAAMQPLGPSKRTKRHDPLLFDTILDYIPGPRGRSGGADPSALISTIDYNEYVGLDRRRQGGQNGNVSVKSGGGHRQLTMSRTRLRSKINKLYEFDGPDKVL